MVNVPEVRLQHQITWEGFHCSKKTDMEAARYGDTGVPYTWAKGLRWRPEFTKALSLLLLLQEPVFLGNTALL